MTITSVDSQQIASSMYLVTWSSDIVGATFYVYNNGELVDITKTNNYTVSVAEGSYPYIEISDSGEIVSKAGQSHSDLEWDQVANTKEYRVEEWDGTSWVVRERIRDDGSPGYQYRSLPSVDETSSQIRVIAVGVNESESSAATSAYATPRHPEIPEVLYTYDGSLNTLTITEI